MSDILKQAEAIKSKVKSSKVTTTRDTAQRNAVPQTNPHNEVMVTIGLVNFHIEGSLSVYRGQLVSVSKAACQYIEGSLLVY